MGEQKAMVARPYQQELLEAALEENTIVNLGTGAGKTYIAVMLVKELSYAIFHQNKRSVFLVTTVPLVKQQAEYIALHTSLDVGQYIGEMNVDSWTRDRWRREFQQKQVLVMTMTIFRNLIQSTFMKFSEVNLLIFDECHHAVKNHDYVQIMKLYNKCCEDNPLGEAGAMRILGLTASLIPSKCKPGDLEKKILELEKTLCCRSQTAEDLMEVAQYATNPEERMLFYSLPSSGPDQKLQDILVGPLDTLERFTKEKKKCAFYEIVKLYLDDCLHILLNLGVWCAHRFACNGLEDVDDKIKECSGFFNSEWEKHLIYMGRTHLQIFVEDSEKVLKRHGNEFHMVDKVEKLLVHLRESAVQSREARNGAEKGVRNKLVGIIFVERRTTAALLCKLLQHQSQKEADLRHIKCDYVVGHDPKLTCTYLRREAQMSSRKQGEVLEKFRRGAINLLVSTSVVEEGMDVPKCNTVVRFDFPQNFRSYVQSKGRARAQKSQYILLIPEEESDKLCADLGIYNELVCKLDAICHHRHTSDSEFQLKEPVEPYENRHGAVQTIHSSLCLVHRYCQVLPKDRYTILTPDFKVEMREITSRTEFNRYRTPGQQYEYCCTLTFPMSSPIKESILGYWFPTRQFAKKSAALEAVKRLDEAGELDCHLKPIAKDSDSDSDVEEEEEEVVDFSRPGEGFRDEVEKTNRLYPNKVAPALTGCFPVAGSRGNHLYIFYISDTSGGLYLSLPDEQEIQLSFGILSSKPLPYLQVPEFSLYNDKKELHVKIVKYHATVTLTEAELEKLKEAHLALFTGVLKIKSWLTCCFKEAEKNYLIVPLRFMPFFDPLEAFVDFELAGLLANVKDPTNTRDYIKPVPWPTSLDEFRDSIVTRNYVHSASLFEVVEVSPDIKASSCPNFETPHPSFKDYFRDKYGCSIVDGDQPGLVCQQLSESDTRLQLLTSRYKTNDGADIQKGKHHSRPLTLFPELCNFYPLPARCWRLSRCIPSILWRVECILAVNSLRVKVASETGIGMFRDGSELTTAVNFSGYKDMAFGRLGSQKLITNSSGELDVVSPKSCDPLEPPLRGPNNSLVLQALIPRGASDVVDLERLETLGDSFLKFSTTVFLYLDRATAHEGKLSEARSRRVSNLNLYRLAKKKGVTNLIFSSSFNPRDMWIPPCFEFNGKHPDLTPLRARDSPSASASEASVPVQAGGLEVENPPTPSQEVRGHPDVPSHSQAVGSVGNSLALLALEGPKSKQEKQYLYHKLTDKRVADSVESLIGAYLVAGGIAAGLKFMTWMGIKLQNSSAMETGNSHGENEETEETGGSLSAYRELEEGELLSSDSSEATDETPCTKKMRFNSEQWLPFFVQNSEQILAEFFHFPPTLRVLNSREMVELKRLLSISSGNIDIERVLGWYFTDPMLLLQAVTHASYTKNRLTECYQRLEFLGDAVLDYLVTSHIYSTFPDYGPGEITSMRSALVNNATFAELTVLLGLHKSLLYSSPSLYSLIGRYLQATYGGDQESMEELIIDSDISSRARKMACNGASASSNDSVEEEEIEYLDPPKVLGDILESLAGAVFIDSGMSLEAVWKIFQPLFDKKIESFQGKIPVGPVHELLLLEPEAKVEKKKEGAKRVRYTITVLHQGTPVRVSAIASTSKAAKAAAAKAVLEKIGKT